MVCTGNKWGNHALSSKNIIYSGTGFRVRATTSLLITMVCSSCGKVIARNYRYTGEQWEVSSTFEQYLNNITDEFTPFQMKEMQKNKQWFSDLHK